MDRLACERHLEDDRFYFNTTYANSYAEARFVLGEKQYDIILTDYFLGDGTGLDILEISGETPVVIMTGAGNEELAVNSLKKGAYDYIVKDKNYYFLKKLPYIINKIINIKNAENEFRALSNALLKLNEAVFLTDSESKIIYLNSNFTENLKLKEIF